MKNKYFTNKIILTIEVILVVLIIIFDLLIPTLLTIVLAFLSLYFRKQNITSLGLKKHNKPLKMVGTILLLSLLWSFVLLALIMPILNHLLGTTQDLTAFENLKGDLGQLLMLLVFSWVLAAFCEEVAYRGYLQKILSDLLGRSKTGIVLTIGISSGLFGLAHSEQGIIGIILTTLDAIIFSLVKKYYGNNLWASILFHGINNTIGMITFFFIGPIYGFW